jgi:hypothetical protein
VPLRHKLDKILHIGRGAPYARQADDDVLLHVHHNGNESQSYLLELPHSAQGDDDCLDKFLAFLWKPNVVLRVTLLSVGLFV